MCAPASVWTSCSPEVSAVAKGFRLRVCFRKVGRLRYLSHLETVRACERAARRAGLPYAVSEGFTPRMKMAFGPALPVGTGGEREYYDVTLTRFVPPERVYEALTEVTGDDLAPVTCGYVSPGEASLASRLTIAEYDVTVEGGIPPEELERSFAALVRTGHLTIEHKGKPKVFDLAETLPKEPEVRSQEDATHARIWIRMGAQGSLRPDMLVVAALGRDVPVTVIRTDLLIEDERGWRRPL